MASTTKMKVENFQSKLNSNITKELLTSISVDIMICRFTDDLRTDIHLGLAATVNYLFFG